MSRSMLAPPLTAALLAILSAPPASGQEAEEPLRAGIIGLDTSHVVAFTKVLNAPEPRPELAGVRVVAAYPAGSPDVAVSRDRIEGFTRQVREEFGVEIVGSIDELLTKVDVVLLESVDGRPHLEQVRPVLLARKPVFIDKPIASSLADAIQIFELAEETGTPCFSGSSLRFSPAIAGLRDDPKLGQVEGCDAYGPAHLEEHHPDLFFYGIHGVEALFTVMGTGCASVAQVQTEGTDLVTGVWNDGRIGTFRGIRRGKGGYGLLAFGSKGIGHVQGSGAYEELLMEVCKFFRTGRPPIDASQTLEIIAFMEAADESNRRGGVAVTLESVMARAREQAARADRPGGDADRP